VIYRFSAISIKISITFLTVLEKMGLKLALVCKEKRPQMSNELLNYNGIITIPDFRKSYRSIVTKKMLLA
jgi:hypothetical protein